MQYTAQFPLCSLCRLHRLPLIIYKHHSFIDIWVNSVIRIVQSNIELCSARCLTVTSQYWIDTYNVNVFIQTNPLTGSLSYHNRVNKSILSPFTKNRNRIHDQVKWMKSKAKSSDLFTWTRIHCSSVTLKSKRASGWITELIWVIRREVINFKPMLQTTVYKSIHHHFAIYHQFVLEFQGLFNSSYFYFIAWYLPSITKISLIFISNLNYL